MIGFPYRPEERRPAPVADRTRGVRVEYGGRWYFFPGGTPAAANVLAKLAGFGPDRPGVRSEFGEVTPGGGWARLDGA